MPPELPKVACRECGCIVPGAVPFEYWKDATIDAAIQRRGRKTLVEQQDKSLRSHPRYGEAMDILRYWRETCRPHAKELEGKRLKLCLDRLVGGSTAEQLKMAVYGYSLKPYVVGGRRTHQGPRDSWWADATLIFRDEPHVAVGIDIAKRAGELEAAFGVTADTSSNGLSALGHAALKVAKTFPVFPVKPADKHPMTKHGFKDANQDFKRISAFWAKHPDANIGLPTGKVAGIVVLDVDGEFGYETLTELEDQYEVLPDTLSVKTPRGGSHLYFQHPGGGTVQNSASLLGPALDVRGDGGYVLAPPSVGANGNKYEIDEETGMAPMPEWLLTLISERQTTITEALRSGELETFFKTGATEGNRNDRLFRFACSEVRRRSPEDAAFVVHGMNKSYVEPPLPDREVDQLIKSALRYDQKEMA